MAPSSLAVVVVVEARDGEAKDGEAVNDDGSRSNRDEDRDADRDRILFRHYDGQNDRGHLSIRSDRMRTVDQTDGTNRNLDKEGDRDDDHVRRQRVEAAAVEAVAFATMVVVHRYSPS